MTHREKRLQSDIQRRWLGLPPTDWARLGLVLAGGALAPIWLLDQAPHWPTDLQHLGTGLALALATLAGALLIYIILRRRISDLWLSTAALLEFGQRALALSQGLVEAIQITRRTDATDWADLIATARAAEVRSEELARELAEHRAGRPAERNLQAIAERVADLQRAIEEIQSSGQSTGSDLAALAAQGSDLLARADYLARELDAIHTQITQRQPAPGDAIDQLILQLLAEDPSTTDDEIGRHPKVGLERSQVTRRRQRLAAAGYTVAQKRQGQRPRRS